MVVHVQLDAAAAAAAHEKTLVVIDKMYSQEKPVVAAASVRDGFACDQGFAKIALGPAVVKLA